MDINKKYTTGKLLKTLVHGLTDRNSAIRKQYAIAIGHLISTAKDSSIERLFAKLQELYFEREGIQQHLLLAQIPILVVCR